MSAHERESIQDFTSIKLMDYGVKPAEPIKDPKSGHTMGGKNATELIQRLTEINGKTIDDLEKLMRPGVLSTAGFLGKEERLLDVLAADNKFVVDDMGLTHQKLARQMHAMGAIWLSQLNDKQENKAFYYNGGKFRVTATVTRDFQDSPFGDGSKSGTNLTVHNLNNDKKLEYGWLVAFMVERFGFYEGQGTPYRAEPRNVVEVFDFLKQKDKQD